MREETEEERDEREPACQILKATSKKESDEVEEEDFHGKLPATASK